MVTAFFREQGEAVVDSYNAAEAVGTTATEDVSAPAPSPSAQARVPETLAHTGTKSFLETRIENGSTAISTNCPTTLFVEDDGFSTTVNSASDAGTISIKNSGIDDSSVVTTVSRCQ